MVFHHQFDQEPVMIRTSSTCNWVWIDDIFTVLYYEFHKQRLGLGLFFDIMELNLLVLH